MTIGPAPMIRIEEMSVRLGMLLVHQFAFPAVIFAAEFIRPRAHLLHARRETLLVNGNRGLEHKAIVVDCGPNLVASPNCGGGQLIEIAVIEVKQRVAWSLPAVPPVCQCRTDLFIAELAHTEGSSIADPPPTLGRGTGGRTKKGRALARPPGSRLESPRRAALFRLFRSGREGAAGRRA